MTANKDANQGEWPMIEARGLTKRYGSTFAVDNRRVIAAITYLES